MKSADEDRIASTFRAGWDEGRYLVTNPMRDDQIEMAFRKALRTYLCTLATPIAVVTT